MSELKVLLIAEHGESRDAYESALKEHGTEYDVLASPAELRTVLRESRYNGLLLDVPTMIRAESADKREINRIIERFPTIRLLYNPGLGGIRGLSRGGTVKDSQSLFDFLDKDCALFDARSIRGTQRSAQVFNVTLLRAGDQPVEQGERTVTFNVSEEGCFLYSSDSWQGEEQCYLVFHDMDDRTPVKTDICWIRPWGESRSIPGIGVRFLIISDGQRQALIDLL